MFCFVSLFYFCSRFKSESKHLELELELELELDLHPSTQLELELKLELDLHPSSSCVTHNAAPISIDPLQATL